MHTGGILILFAGVCIGTSLILALLFRYWPRYGSVEAAITRSDKALIDMEAPSAEH
jgi:hypothetical protein